MRENPRKLSFYSLRESGEESHVFEGLDAMRVFSSFGVVFLHVCAATGTPPSLETFLKFRDFALPVLVMTSFFLLTASFIRDEEKVFGQFFIRRFARLWIPFFVWTLLYILLTGFLVPLMTGLQAAESFSPLVFLTGYRHLWYLQFIFIGSLAVYCVLFFTLRCFRPNRGKLSLLCLSGALIYWIFYYFVLGRNTSWQSFIAEADINLQIFALQTSYYAGYIPLAIGLGLVGDRLQELFRHGYIRRLSLLAAVLTMALYLRNLPFAPAREIYGAAVFVAALQPWKKIPDRLFRKIVAYSYGIYIFHFFGIQILGILIARCNIEIDGALIVFFSLLIYAAGLLAAVLIRKLFPFDWVLPLVRVPTESSERSSILRLVLAEEK